MLSLSIERRLLAAQVPPSDPCLPTDRHALHAALASGQFEPYYQPQIELATGRLRGVEILARWRRPGIGVLTPAAFIAAMEETPLIDTLTEQLLKRALQDAKEWPADPLSLALNVAPRTLENAYLTDRLLSLVCEHDFPPERITLELTETAVARNPGLVHDCTTRLRSRGFGVAIDDFGTGYSSMALLLEVPFTELKIDQAFVTRLADSRRAHILLETMVALGSRLGMSVLAEGVESEAESELLRGIGCPAAQGYHFAHPMSNEELLAWLASRVVHLSTAVHYH